MGFCSYAMYRVWIIIILLFLFFLSNTFLIYIHRRRERGYINLRHEKLSAGNLPCCSVNKSAFLPETATVGMNETLHDFGLCSRPIFVRSAVQYLGYAQCLCSYFSSSASNITLFVGGYLCVAVKAICDFPLLNAIVEKWRWGEEIQNTNRAQQRLLLQDHRSE